MCGRSYATYTDDELHARYLTKKGFQLSELRPNYNLSPTQFTPIVRRLEEGLQLNLFKWGLIPSWSKDPKVGYKMINARSETVAEKPSFRTAYKKRRCIVPVSGFYEWKREGEEKRPFRIFLKDEPIMSLAGIWEEWTDEKGEVTPTFSILTTSPNSFMEKIHDRMPVILSREDEATWLDPSNTDPSNLLKPCPSQWMDGFEVSKLVNSPRNNRPEVLDPIK